MVEKAVTAVAKGSYDRCCKAAEFIPAFYRNFFAACPEAKPRFAKTNFETQAKLLQHAIGLLLVFPTQPRDEPPLLARVAERHSRRGLDINPAFYDPFIEALITTVKQYDGEWTPAIEVAWRETVAPGVQYMKSVH
jgi:hemoglobin-like flavoprotein